MGRIDRGMGMAANPPGPIAPADPSQLPCAVSIPCTKEAFCDGDDCLETFELSFS